MLKSFSPKSSVLNRSLRKRLISRINIQRSPHYRAIHDMVDSETSDPVMMSRDLELVKGSARESKRGKGGGGKQNHGGGKSGKGGGGRTENREVMVSKALSKLLRHAAGDVGLALDTEGFARVDQVVSVLLLFCFVFKSPSKEAGWKVFYMVTCHVMLISHSLSTTLLNSTDAMAAAQIFTCHVRGHSYRNNR